MFAYYFNGMTLYLLVDKKLIKNYTLYKANNKLFAKYYKELKNFYPGLNIIEVQGIGDL